MNIDSDQIPTADQVRAAYFLLTGRSWRGTDIGCLSEIHLTVAPELIKKLKLKLEEKLEDWK